MLTVFFLASVVKWPRGGWALVVKRLKKLSRAIISAQFYDRQIHLSLVNIRFDFFSSVLRKQLLGTAKTIGSLVCLAENTRPIKKTSDQ